MIEDKIFNRVEEEISPLGYKLVKVRLISHPKMKTLQIMAEKGEYESLDINDCKTINNQISEVFEGEDLISGEFNLEVSSPGLERPLIEAKDYKKFEGFLISLKTQAPVDGSRKFKGRIKLLGDDKIILKNNKEEEILNTSFSDIYSAKIVITDDLLKTKGRRN